MSHFLFAGGGGGGNYHWDSNFRRISSSDLVMLVILFEKCLDESIYLKAKYNDMQMFFTKITNINRGRFFEKRSG